MTASKKSFLGTLKVSATIAQKQAAIKKLEMSDLRAIHAKLGEYAYTNEIGTDQLASEFTAIGTLDAEVQTKRTHAPLPDTATIADKAKHMAILAKDRATVEALLLRRKGIVADLGRAICGYEVDDQTISSLRQEARKLEEQIAAIKAEVSSLEQQVSGIAKRPFIAGSIAVVGIVVVLGALAGLRTSCSQSGQIKRATREAHQAAANIGKEVAAMQKEMLDLDMQMKKEELEEAEKRKLQEAKSELQRKQRELELQREREQREAERLTSDLRRKQEAEERELQKKAEASERLETDRQRQIREQADRKELANKRFTGISLTPTFYPSRTVAASGAQMEVRGKNWDEIKKLHEAGDWLALINLLLGQSYKEYPEAYQIDRAVRDLEEYGLFILCRTPLRKENDRQLILLTLPIREYNVVDESTDWTAHPDGIGFTHKWSPAHGGGIVLYGNVWRQYRDQINRLNEAFRRSKEALDQKLKLGEISQATHADRLRELIDRAHTEAVTWARQQ